eukprot:CAMPEP_0176166904 /NCGR_PEP_ID=MMETSP0120_2-20121206/85371_1 /TAXON_ID=160619 /ORGANISM="Kryptoperidinium foliaceum, Strain CCMP 1326" /LENGTH=155 /DNA_ID=CAMNT_0017504475 /DNA_START=200 /DNA_END=664 /DNA_ORIENTATION=-
MAKDLPLDADEDPRGLEHKTPKGNKRRHKNRIVAIDAVLTEQDRQWERDRRDASFIADLYMQANAHCRLQASLIAQSDEEYVVKHVRNGSLGSYACEDETEGTIEEEPVRDASSSMDDSLSTEIETSDNAAKNGIESQNAESRHQYIIGNGDSPR